MHTRRSGRIRVAMLTTSYPSASNPAAGCFVARLAETLAVRAEITVLTPSGTAPEAETNVEAVKTIRFRYAPRTWQTLAQSPGGVPVALRRNPWLALTLPLFIASMFIAVVRHGLRSDIIHANWAACGVVAGLAGLLMGRPVVTTLRGSDVRRVRESVIQRAILRACLASSSRVICVSDSIRTLLAESFPERAQRLMVIPNGVDAAHFAPHRRATIEPGRLRLITVGSLIPRKSLQTLIAALDEPHLSGATLTIVGDGPDRGALERMVDDASLGPRIRFCGTVPPTELPTLLADADVFVLSSVFEGRPNVVLEAMAAGLAAVATRIDGVTELIEHERNGLLFEPGDAAGLACQLRRLAAEPELLERLGRAAQQTIQDFSLTWERAADDYLEAYRQATDRTRASTMNTAAKRPT
ncbi:MAG: glycosyltransferase family 4 protein [Methylotetracoccus sp.]